jgi:hypothetical protein
VAKDAAAMVLTDDNFATIEAAIEEGRGVYDNLVKFIIWTLPTNFGEGLVILFAVLAGVTLPITPLQILWINMTTAVLLGLALAFEPIQRDVMAPAAAGARHAHPRRGADPPHRAGGFAAAGGGLRVVPALAGPGRVAGGGAHGGGQCVRRRRDRLSLQLPQPARAVLVLRLVVEPVVLGRDRRDGAAAGLVHLPAGDEPGLCFSPDQPGCLAGDRRAALATALVVGLEKRLSQGR